MEHETNTERLLVSNTQNNHENVRFYKQKKEL